MDWPPGTLAWQLPVTLGHETAGTVAALGAGVTVFAEGDPVLIYGPWGCGVCRQCARGAENLCPRRQGCGLGRDGGLAEFVLVPSARLLVPRGDLDAAHAAPLADAALTPYHALKPHLSRLVPGSDVVIIGAGGLGNVAVQLVRELSSARTVVVDLRERARREAIAVGADAALDAGEIRADRLRGELASGGAALVLDFVGSDETVRLAAGVIETGGHVSIVGSGGSTFPFAINSVPLEWSAGRPSWGTRPELHEVVALAQAGRIKIEVEPLTFEEAIEGYRRLRRGGIAGRAVVIA
jgi:propanol-preferring alcohol dehydrogenase